MRTLAEHADRPERLAQTLYEAGEATRNERDAITAAADALRTAEHRIRDLEDRNQELQHRLDNTGVDW